jgi:hypothetical protein
VVKKIMGAKFNLVDFDKAPKSLAILHQKAISVRATTNDKKAFNDELKKYLDYPGHSLLKVEDIAAGEAQKYADAALKAALPEPQPPAQPKNNATIQPSMITQNKIEDEIASLRLETDMTRFNDRLDELADYIESVGLMEQYDKELNELADIAAQMAIENSKKVGV